MPRSCYKPQDRWNKSGLLINMDYETPDDNIFAVYEVLKRYRRYGA